MTLESFDRQIKLTTKLPGKLHTNRSQSCKCSMTVDNNDKKIANLYCNLRVVIVKR